MIDWLLAPIDPSRTHDLGMLVSWHARLMVLAWAVCVPLGVMAARYIKIAPGQDWPRVLDTRLWWNIHRGFQYTAGVTALAALGLALVATGPMHSTTASFWVHSLFGWAVLALASVQFASAWTRGTKGGPTDRALDGTLRGDHYDMTPRRVLFEHVHKFGGVLALFLSVLAILTGLWQANAPHWMWGTLILWWGLLGVCVLVFERRIGAIDTYQAIWGPDPALPGNRRRPIGLGVRRKASER